MPEEHLTCPKCGYDLYGIPEVRCPECGFGFDYAALRRLGASAEWGRWAAARTIVVRTAPAVALYGCVVAANLPLPLATRLILSAAPFAAACVTCVVFSEICLRPASIAPLMTLFVGLAVVVAPIMISVPVLAIFAATVLTVSAWVVRLRRWPALNRSADAATTPLQRSVDRHSLGADSTLMLATVLSLLAWFY